ncbi:hypothetical protein TEA_011111 [Camellia sinensis var. sinensis]|uniref:Uncharacterized protein n=1 Tax=Camellia sinensis var. sinensis TaxID=542762 RepID=A0A4S4E8I4_CAMSN|nr:hypothetical protein TEA_011111 [Camellia sinensis var. sinensis]
MLRKTKNYQNNYAPRVVSIGPYHHDHNNLKLQRMQELKRRITTRQSQNPKPLCIQRLPQMLRKTKNYQNNYAPRVVSIGPYHHDHNNLKLQRMQELKRRITNSLMAPNVGKIVEELCPLHLLDVLHKRLKNKKSSCLTDINFSSFCNFGRLELPIITVDDSTEAKFLNLIAYEMCGDTPNNLWVTSYICFLDSLIDNPNDVKELRSAHILQNCLGSDVEAATLFNKIGKDLVPHPCAYASVKKEIQSHNDNKGKAFIAQFKHRYFKSPWSFLALLGALLALVFSGIQAGYQIWPQDSECDNVCKYIKITRHI